MSGTTLVCKTCGAVTPDTAAARRHATKTGHRQFTHRLSRKYKEPTT